MRNLMWAVVLVAFAVSSPLRAQTTKGIGDAKSAAGAASGGSDKGGGKAADTSGGGASAGSEDIAGKGKFTFVNQSSKPVKVWLGEVLVGDVEAGGRKEFAGYAEGSRLITVVSGDESRRWGPKHVTVSKEYPGEVSVSDDATSGVKLLNYTKDAVIVILGERQIARVEGNGGVGLFMEMPPSTGKFTARAASGKLQYSPKYIEIKEGQIFEWRLGNPPAAGAAPAK